MKRRDKKNYKATFTRSFSNIKIEVKKYIEARVPVAKWSGAS